MQRCDFVRCVNIDVLDLELAAGRALQIVQLALGAGAFRRDDMPTAPQTLFAERKTQAARGADQQ